MIFPVCLVLATLSAALPLRAQTPVHCLPGASNADLGCLILAREAEPAALVRSAEVAGLGLEPDGDDAGSADRSPLLYSDLNTLAPAEAFCPLACETGKLPAEAPAAVPRGPAEPVTAGPGHAGSTAGSVAAVWQMTAASPPQVTADPVPEPSVILLIAGAAAWILLRRKP
jgi:hypothetical protein